MNELRSMEELIEQGRIGHAMVSQLDVARALGVTRQAVQIAERKAMRKLRKGLLECPEVREWLESRGIDANAETRRARGEAEKERTEHAVGR